MHQELTRIDALQRIYTREFGGFFVQVRKRKYNDSENQLACHVHPKPEHTLRDLVDCCSSITRVSYYCLVWRSHVGLCVFSWIKDQRTPRTAQQDARRACINRSTTQITTHQRSHIKICELEYEKKAPRCAKIFTSSRVLMKGLCQGSSEWSITQSRRVAETR